MRGLTLEEQPVRSPGSRCWALPLGSMTTTESLSDGLKGQSIPRPFVSGRGRLRPLLFCEPTVMTLLTSPTIMTLGGHMAIL